MSARHALTLKVTAAALLAATLAAAPALAVKTEGAAAAGVSPTPPDIIVFNQKLTGKGVDVAYAYLPAQGYLVVYGMDASGKPTAEPLATLPLAAGDHRNVKVEFSKAPAAGTALWASLYKDVDGDKAFDKSKDVSFWGEQQPVVNQFQIQG